MKKRLIFLSLCAALARANAGPNLLTNPGFEFGDGTGWNGSYGNYSVVGISHSGLCGAQIQNYADLSQTVTGLSPNTTYTCAGWFHVLRSADHVYWTAKNYGGADLTVWTASTNYTPMSLSFTTGSTNTSAEVHIIVWNSGAIGLCDDLSLSGPAGTNMLVNPGFETGSASGWSGACSVLAAHSGNFAVQVQTNSQIGQIVTGLSPNTTYSCSGWVRVTTAGQRAYLIAQDFGGSALNTSTASITYSNLVLTFTTGPTNTSAQIELYQSGANPAFCDDFVLSVTNEPPLPPGSVPGLGDQSGTQAWQIADCLQRFGVNTFSLLTNNGYPWRWGGSQGSYDSATTARAINYITGGSGLIINVREYHRDSGNSIPITPLQKSWIRAVNAATGSPFTIAIAAFGGTNDVPGIITLLQDSISSGLNYVKWVEGINEPNNFGPIPTDVDALTQSMLYQQVRAVTTNVVVMGPSIVVGMPGPSGWITGYLSTNLSSVLSNSDANNLHVYPPYSPNSADANIPAGTLADFNSSYASVLPSKPAINTEWHPTYYSNIHKTNDTYDAYYGPIYLLSSYCDFDWKANFWFSLFNYDPTNMITGLFATSDADPKPVAKSLRALFRLTGDAGTNKLTFKPGKLDVTISGLPHVPSGSPYAGGRSALFQNSAQQYFLLIWNEQNNISTATTPVAVTFNSHAMAKVEEFNVTSGSETAVQTLTNVHTMTVNLDTSVRLLRITYDATPRYGGMTVQGKNAVLNYAGMPGYSYTLRRSTDLVNWTTVYSTNAPVTGWLSFVDSFSDLGSTAPPAAYYRVLLNP